VRIVARHGAGVSVMLAQLARQVERECGMLGWEGGTQVIYYRALPWHSPSYLVWYLCSAASLSTAVRPSWRALTDLLVRRSVDQVASLPASWVRCTHAVCVHACALVFRPSTWCTHPPQPFPATHLPQAILRCPCSLTVALLPLVPSTQGLATVLVLDGITPVDALALSDALAAARQAQAAALAILALASSAAPPAPAGERQPGVYGRAWEVVHGLGEAGTRANTICNECTRRRPEGAPSPAPGAAAAAATALLAGDGAASAAQLPACVEFAMGELPAAETRLLLGACLRSLADGGTGAGGEGKGAGVNDAGPSGEGVSAAKVAMCEERVAYVLERLNHPRAACAGARIFFFCARIAGAHTQSCGAPLRVHR
jgi:hypothetical protein